MRFGARTLVFTLSLVWLSLVTDGARGQSCGRQGDCDDGNPCSLDYCDPVYGCFHSPATGNPCQPADRCLTDGLCNAGRCLGGTPLSCDDGLACTVDACDPAVGCTHTSQGCDDGDACTNDACVADPNVCEHTSIACNDGNTCTDDACDPSAGCVYLANGSCSENPKSLGFWQRICRDMDHSGEFFTEADVSCMQSISCVARDQIRAVSDICRLLDIKSLNPGMYPCLRAVEEVAALSLNICRGRVEPSQGIDAQCADFTVVQDAFDDADQRLCADRFSSDDYCRVAWCETHEINIGTALHVHGLVVSRLGTGAVRLVWIRPIADTDSLSATPRRYRVWRASEHGAPFVQIAEVADPLFDDTAPEGAYLQYDVTPVW